MIDRTLFVIEYIIAIYPINICSYSTEESSPTLVIGVTETRTFIVLFIHRPSLLIGIHLLLFV